MISFHLKGKTALVTGAASGVGFATAKMLLESGAAVAINFLPDDPRGREAVAELESIGRVVPAPGNVADATSVEEVVSHALLQLGRLDLLVNNAATPGVQQPIPPARIDLVTEELWHTLLDVNLIGVFRCSTAAAPALKASKGAIVNVASTAGIDGRGSTIPYAATKAGVLSLTKNFARALSPDVRVNAVAPGSIESSWINWSEEARRAGVERSLLKRVSKPTDIAEAIVYLGVAAQMVTGTALVVDGGYLIA